jgi:hypothetical protein
MRSQSRTDLLYEVLCQARDNVLSFQARGSSCDLIETWTVIDQGTDEDHNRFPLSWDIGQE